MKKINQFLQGKGFYVALTVGIIAFATLIFLYDYQDANEEITREQAIDLNQAKIDSTEEKDDEQLANNNTSIDNDIAATSDNKKETSESNTEDIAGKTDATTEDFSETALGEDYVLPAGSDGAVANLTAGMNYEGTQDLIMPINGTVIIPYSMDTTVYFKTLDEYKCNPGVLLQGEEGNSVFAAYEGVVEAVEDTAQYGTVVTVDMGNGFKARYGQLMNVTVKQGDNVAKAQTIGQIGPVSSYYRLEGTHLYFEITRDGTPVNPMTLFQ